MSWITSKLLFISDRDFTLSYHILRLLNNCFYLVKRLLFGVDLSLALWKSLIVYKEKYEKNCIGCWKCYSCNDINRFSHTYRMWRLLFAHLNKAGLRTNIIWIIILVTVFCIVNVCFSYLCGTSIIDRMGAWAITAATCRACHNLIWCAGITSFFTLICGIERQEKKNHADENTYYIKWKNM